eukprot:TRINITY_DN5876_c3_g1_i1.p1 TRINITY_DN5876_c3_g1~~TRINITY_DN5876_c3_g1_i1.p1  ORF type:complete len:241 (+),score=103.38 TRINITY_DN5876_c3_g1_i1:86-724(+)
MVYYYTIACSPDLICFVGEDKYENEHLIAYGWPEDVWFHVDAHSSAHIYARLPQGKTIDDLTEEQIEHLAQLTKQNSIEGCKLPNIKVVYTPWANLKKEDRMAVGQVGFHKGREVRSVMVAKKKSEITNPQEKSRRQVQMSEQDFRRAREERDREIARQEKMAMLQKRDEEKRRLEEERKMKEQKSYAGWGETHPDLTQSNQDAADLEDDFM